MFMVTIRRSESMAIPYVTPLWQFDKYRLGFLADKGAPRVCSYLFFYGISREKRSCPRDIHRAFSPMMYNTGWRWQQSVHIISKKVINVNFILHSSTLEQYFTCVFWHVFFARMNQFHYLSFQYVNISYCYNKQHWFFK